MNYEITLPRRALPQPSPAIVPIGDCGACALGGLLNLTVEQIYELSKEGQKPLNYWSMKAVIALAESKGLVSRYVMDVPSWPSEQHHPAQLQFGLPSWMQSLPYFDYIRMALDGGYYGVACVASPPSGPFADGNHWVLVAGVKSSAKPTAVRDCFSIQQELLISNSATSQPKEAWIEVSEFLKHWGGFNLFLVRP